MQIDPYGTHQSSWLPRCFILKAPSLRWGWVLFDADHFGIRQCPAQGGSYDRDGRRRL